MTDPARWLDARTPPMPEELRQALDAALERAAPEQTAPEQAAPEQTDPVSTADRLAAAGLGALRRSIDEDVAAEPDRQRAIDLLAADALLTYACEAAAEEGPEAVDRLTGSLDFRRFAALLGQEAT